MENDPDHRLGPRYRPRHCPAFARLGADVFVNFFRNRSTAQETADEIRAVGRRSWLVKADIGDLDDLARLFEYVEREAGGWISWCVTPPPATIVR